MKLYHLRSFVTVANERSLTRASQLLFTSQPAVSAHIKTLEEELDVVLFSRTPRGMELTREGRLLKEQAEKCLSNVSEFFRQARRLKADVTGTVKISIHADPDMLKIGDFLSIVHARYPRMDCHVLRKDSCDVAALLHNRRLDAGYLYGHITDKEIATTLLRTCKLMIVGPVHWRERFEYADLKELGNFPWIGTSQSCPFHAETFEIFQQRQLKISNTIAVVDQESTLLNLVSAGIGLALLVDEEALSAEESGKVVIWKPERFTIDLCLAYLQEREKDPLLQAVLDGLYTVWGLADIEHGRFIDEQAIAEE
ncbi:LysR family transcriptional regulator [candidate division KSB3 bacterium]|uniref:LysR family transcriptional regulator n=1 Tax=candidate division KSB3 bacterium TaxID=2044937 RepID=A0A2G6E393_9BACT|nr:MAG: LysR family transcriptional regulator [candidate division KSB3 bacterium]PIE29064.1 MAG: LysR family transcriptional regulator [candidate division KSB3 bacterium]